MFKEQHHFIREYFAIAELNPLLFAFNLITAFLYKAADIFMPFVAALIIKALTEQNVDEAYLYIGIFAATYLTYRLSLYINFRAYSRNVSYSYCAMQTKVFNKLLLVDSDFTRKISKGQLMNTINTDLIAIGELNDEISEYIATFFQIAAIVTISAIYCWPVTILMCISVIWFVRIREKNDRRFNHYWWKTQTENDKYSNFLGQVMTGLQEVKTFNMLPKLHGHLDRIQNRYDKSYMIQRKYVSKRDNDVKYEFYTFRVIITILMIILMMNGLLTIDIFVLMISYHSTLRDTAKDLTDATVDIRLANASVRRVAGILNYRTGKPIEFGDVNIDKLKGSLQFKNVSLSLNHHQILRDLNFKIKPHEFVAIVGYPGSGKTKLFDLILRINKPTKGKILLDGINVNEFSKDIYTSNVAVANQVPFIFNMSIRKNLNFVDDDIKHQIKACKITGIHDFIETLPMGYNTILRENATNISGGQRQMISIARTLLTNSEVLLLDDVTTSLDPDTAELVPRLIKNIRDTHTVIMITKKPDLMKLADKIIVLDHGKISDMGTHEKLLERSKLYRSLQAIKSNMGGAA
ncbi:ABC transporter ATP-binding protein [Candidatus Saccharibacteria bacterium]|nr:ABC transporter ATP-binding protein [Candidatus Saccharibacteria bacterium]MBR3233815.1 ABC transporter ATP-binding protein [Candidatus Saccharibacteria bacterium]